MNIEKRVIKIMSDQLGIREDEITLDSTEESLGMDSLDNVEFLMAIENEFDLEIPDEYAEKLQSINHIVEYVTKEVD